jgi:ribose/xylose/arabinose/galactoside ABC-type transport system permease subunit
MDHPSSQGRASTARVQNFDIFGFLSTYGTLIALVCLIAFNLLHTPNFTTLETLNINLTQVAGIVIVAVGMTLVIATGGISVLVR